MSMYDRQKDLGLNTDITITIIGCGGIGFWAAKFFAMSGVNTMYLFDPDVLENVNLNRLDLPVKVLGKNKADITKVLLKEIREDINVKSFPFMFKSHMYFDSDWIVDCTDNIKSQRNNEKIAKEHGVKYCKLGYDGFHISINNVVASWDDGTEVDGYTITPSFVCPAVIVAAMGVLKVLKFHDREMGCNIYDLFYTKKV